MPLFDVIVIFVIIASVALAFAKGIIGSVFSFAGWALAIILAYSISPLTQEYLADYIENDLVIKMVANSGLLLIFLLIFGILNAFILSKISALRGGMIDRSLGAIFGLFRGIFIVSFFYVCMLFVMSIVGGQRVDDKLAPSWVRESNSYNIIKKCSMIIIEIIPDSLHERIEKLYSIVAKKAVDETFLENSIQNLSSKMLPKDIEKITDVENSTELSNKEIKIEKLKKLVENYNENEATKKSNDSPSVDEEEMKKIKEYISSQ